MLTFETYDCDHKTKTTKHNSNPKSNEADFSIKEHRGMKLSIKKQQEKNMNQLRLTC